METDVLILGGGLAGLAAAYEVATRGLQVTIAEESWSLGGQLRQQTQILEFLPQPFTGLRGFELAKKLEEHLKGLPIKILLGHTVIGTYADGSIGVSNESSVQKIMAKSVIVATGANEIPLAFPGWTLPGVMTLGAAQILINRERVYPGKTTIVIGSSDLAFEVARQMHDVGITILGIVEEATQPICQDQELIADLAACDIPIFLNTQVNSVLGSGRVEKVLLSPCDDSSLHSSSGDNIKLREFVLDFVCLDGGRQPIIEPLYVLKCELRYQEQLGGWLPCYNLSLQTNVKGVIVAGNTAGVTTQAGILFTGTLAGLSATAYLKEAERSEIVERQRELWQELYNVEAMKSPQVWDGRIKHMSSYLQTKIHRDPSQW